MKKRNLLLLALLLPLTLAAGTIEKTYTFDAPGLSRMGDYDRIGFPGCKITGLAGEPGLPYMAVALLLAPGEKAVSVSFEGYGLKEIPGSLLLAPAQPARPPAAENASVWLFNEAVYHSHDAYPRSQTGQLSTSYLHGRAVALSSFTPLRYFPATRKAYYYSSVRIRVETAADDAGGLLPPPRAPHALAMLAALVQNPELAPLYPPVVDDSSAYEVLIITPELFGGQFQSLIDANYIRGLKTRAIYVQNILQTFPGNDAAEKIRNCIIHEYLNNQIQHVLLAGDVEHIPARGFYCFVQSGSGYTDNNIPADLYYAALDGNWNTDGDNLWGEPGEEDLLPELSVGRLPVSTVAELQNLLAKSLHYRHHPVPDDCRKPLLLGEKLWDNPLTWGGDYLDLIIGPQSANGYNTLGIPAWNNIQQLYDRDLPAPWTASSLLTAINQGPSFLHHVGHASTNYLMRMSSSSITNNNFQQINGINHNYIPIYSHGCYCAAFDESDCIAEKMLNLDKLAIAFFGNSRYGWFNEGQTEGPSQHLHREFVNALYADRQTEAGMAHSFSKIRSAPWVTAPGQWEDGALRWCFYGCNLLGDPGMPLWTDRPLSLNISHPDTLFLPAACLGVQCDTSGSGVAGLSCTLLTDSLMLATATTNSLGFAQLCPVDPLPANTLLMLVVSGPDCIPDTSWVQVQGANSLQGYVRYANTQQSPMPLAMVRLFQQDSLVYQAQASANGQFSIQGINPGSYQLKIEVQQAWGGANATDALAILKHFVSLEPLSGLKLKAADADNNFIVNTIDALYVQKRFVGMISSFPAGNFCSSPPNIIISAPGNVNADFYVLCTGDVNASYSPPATY